VNNAIFEPTKNVQTLLAVSFSIIFGDNRKLVKDNFTAFKVRISAKSGRCFSNSQAGVLQIAGLVQEK
jgi:hypothetical protein